MSDFAWFGYPALENSLLAWGARAIFHPSAKLPLDILWDRQGHKYDRDTQKEAYRQFVTFINQSVLPKLQELAHYFAPSDDGKFLWHFEWPHDSNMVVVATGSPNASYGYFYISVNLVPKEGAPEVVWPKGYRTPDANRTEESRPRKRRQNPRPRRSG
ncbi:MAG: hypothetical protein ACLQNE_15120 [Thermoguttaceae bacterium]